MDKGSREIQKIELVGLSLVEKLNPNSAKWTKKIKLEPPIGSSLVQLDKHIPDIQVKLLPLNTNQPGEVLFQFCLDTPTQVELG